MESLSKTGSARRTTLEEVEGMNADFFFGMAVGFGLGILFMLIC